MIFRAIFWIGVVALLMPHEPNLGFGRPEAAGTAALSGLADAAKTEIEAGANSPSSLCHANASACTVGVTLFESFRSSAVKSLAGVKADIRQNAQIHLR